MGFELCGPYRGRLSAGGLGPMLRPSSAGSRAYAGRVSFREPHMVEPSMAAKGRGGGDGKYYAAFMGGARYCGGLAVIWIAE